MSGGNGTSQHLACTQAVRLREIEDQQASITEELVKLNNRIGHILPDGAATPHSLTSLTLDLGAQMVVLNQRLNMLSPKIDALEDESEKTSVQSRRELIERARTAERQLTARAARVDKVDKVDVIGVVKLVLMVAALLASGAGGSQIVQLLLK